MAPSPTGARPVQAALLALVPGVAYVGSLTVADPGIDATAGAYLPVASLYVLLVGLTSLLPLLAARPGRSRLVVLAVLCGVAVYAAIAQAGSDDAQAGLLVLLILYAAVPLAALLGLGEAVLGARRRPADAIGRLAPTGDRIVAVIVDVVLVGAVLLAPLTSISHAGEEVLAGVIGVAVGTAYLAVFPATGRPTLGQRLLRIARIDAGTGRRLGTGRATIGALVLVLELVGSVGVVLLPLALAELLAAAAGGRSLTDRVLRTVVVTRP